MKPKILALAMFALAACEAAPMGQVEDTRISTEADFRTHIVGKPLTYIDDAGNPDPRVRITVSADGTLSGRGLLDDGLTGAWWWEGSYWCRKLVGRVNAPAEDCQVMRFGDGVLTVIRDRGQGERVRYTTLDPALADKRTLADRIHASIMDRFPEYGRNQSMKVMVACIRWDSPTPPRIQVKGATYTYTDAGSDGQINPAELRHDALRRCRGWAARENIDCTCQAVDDNGKNVLRVP